jgi:uncharacterized protein (TIGR00255 family)
MTGQGAAQTQQGDLFVSAEIRTVNSRYYKLALRTSDGYASLESRVDELARKLIRRGTVQLDLRIDHKSKANEFQINQTVIAGYHKQLQAIAAGLDLPPPSLDELLVLPGVVEEPNSSSADIEADWPLVRDAVRQALDGLAKMRADEGRAMAADLADNCQLVRQQLTAVEQRAPIVVEQYRDRIADRVNKLLAEFEVRIGPDDVIREVSLFAERCDIAEEVVRLRSHLDQFHEIMQLPESSGRKLEFVTQEMFREANTIGSKANDSEIAKNVVEIKAAVERIREMIQNIE